MTGKAGSPSIRDVLFLKGMNLMTNQLISYLFNTKAIRVCPKDKPFWYTSGKIGPYYVNTHFLYGSEESANAFLARIDGAKEDKLRCSDLFFQAAYRNYTDNAVYRGTMDALAAYVKEQMDLNSIDYVSGGERRDWFFSFLVARFFNKPHITLFKDGDAVIYESGKSIPAHDLKGANILHVADLITTASSYERAWVPAIQKLNGVMKWSLVVVDRLQGGGEVLKKLGVDSHSLVRIDREVFEKAFAEGYINEGQLHLVQDYMQDGEKSMRSFLEHHPQFLKQALEGGGKEAERASLLLQNNFYQARELMG